jgi:PAS domain S-box-containing protein
MPLTPPSDVIEAGPRLGTAALVATHDWAATPLGPRAAWPTALRTLVEVMLGSAQPMFVSWGASRVMIYNDAYAEILATKHPAAMGRDFFEVWHEIRADLTVIVDAAYAGMPVQMDDITPFLQRRGFREEAHFAFSYTPVRDEGGSIAGFFCVCAETTGQIMAERQLRESEARARMNAERVQLALAAGAIIGTWDWDLVADHFTADERFARSFGLDPQLCHAGLNIERVVATVHPDDKPGLMAAIAEVKGRGGAYAHQYRVRRDDGLFHWIEANGRVDLAQDRTPLRFPGVLLDITERREAEARLRASEAKFQAIANSIDQMIWSTRPDGFHDYFNDRWYEYTGVPHGSTDGDAWRGLFHPDDQGRIQDVWQHSLGTGEPYRIEYRLRHASGEYRWVSGRAQCVRDERGAISRWYGTCTDIHDLKTTEAALAEALEMKEALLYEVNHRVKNNLQVVSSLLTMQSSRSANPDVRRDLDDARARVGVVAAIHQSLYTTATHSEVEMRGFIRTLAEDTLDSMCAAGRIVLRMDGAGDAVLPLPQALPLALVVSELLTNAVKYAFPDDRPGVIAVSIERNAQGLRVRVADDGVGLPAAPDPARPPGIGMKVIRMLARQLRATFGTLPSERGAAFEVTLPPK